MNNVKMQEVGKKTVNAEGETVIRIGSDAPLKASDLRVTGAQPEALSLWEILVDRTRIQSFDGSREILLKPVTLRTLAKLEKVQASHDPTSSSQIDYAIKFLTVLINDTNSRPKDKDPMTEDQVGDLLDGKMFPVAMRVIQEAMRPLTESLNALMAGAVQATDGAASSDTSPMPTAGM